MEAEYRPTRTINIVGRFEIKLQPDYHHLAKRVFAMIGHPFAQKATMNWDENRRKFVALCPQTDLKRCVMYEAATVKIYAPWSDLNADQKAQLFNDYGGDVSERYEEFEITSPTSCKPV